MRSNRRNQRKRQVRIKPWQRSPYVQLEFDFSIIPDGTNVIVEGKDVMGYADFTGSIGIVEGIYPNGDYSIFFPDKEFSWGLAILFYRSSQLTIIPGKKSKTSWQRKRLMKRVLGKRSNH